MLIRSHVRLSEMEIKTNLSYERIQFNHNNIKMNEKLPSDQKEWAVIRCRGFVSILIKIVDCSL